MICAIVLAAGESKRMGTQKLLLDYGGKSVICRIADQLTASIAEQVYVVTGCDAKRITQELSNRPASIIVNENFKLGMLSSVRCALRTIPGTCKAVLIALGDQPSITTQLVNVLLEAYRDTDKSIVIPTYKGKRGHPVIVSAKYKNEILTKYDDVGLRGLIHEHSDDVFELSVSMPDVCSDMNIPADYQRQIEMLRKRK